MKRYFRKNRTSVVLFLVSNLLAAVSSVLMSFLLGLFADSAMEGELSRVWKIALVTLVYLCVETFFAFLLDYSRDIVVQRVGRDLRADAVRKIESLSYMQKSEKDDGACLSLVQNDVDTIQQDYVASLGEIYFQICCFLLAVASAAAIQPVMTLIMIAVSVLTRRVSQADGKAPADVSGERAAGEGRLSDGDHADLLWIFPAENFQRIFRCQPRP